MSDTESKKLVIALGLISVVKKISDRMDSKSSFSSDHWWNILPVGILDDIEYFSREIEKRNLSPVLEEEEEDSESSESAGEFWAAPANVITEAATDVEEVKSKSAKVRRSQ